MSTHAQRGAILGILAALLLANPLYMSFLFADGSERSDMVYRAEEITLSNSTDRDILITRLGDEEVLEYQKFERLRYTSSERFARPQRIAKLLRDARSGNTLSIDHPTVRSDFRYIKFNYRYVRFEEDQLYRLNITQSDSTTLLRLAQVDETTVATYLAVKDRLLYDGLSSRQQEVVDNIIHHGDAYQPLEIEARPPTERLIWKDGTYYLIYGSDDGFSINTLPFLVSVGLSVLGAVALLGAVGFTTLSFRSK